MKDLPRNTEPSTSSATTPAPETAPTAVREGGRGGAKLRFELPLRPGDKSKFLNAADRERIPFHRWIVESLRRAAEDGPRCQRDGMPMPTTYPVDGEPYVECVVCRLRREMEDERARVARMECEYGIDESRTI